MARKKLSTTQMEFAAAMTKLLAWAHRQPGYGVTFGDFFAKTGHIEGSYHYKKLAADLNLFIDGKYQTTTAAHQKMGEKWEKLGGTWGGRFKRVKDGNHYSWGENRGNS